MSDLNYTQAGILRKVPGMPIGDIMENGDLEYYLIPGLPLTMDQAGICLCVGIEVEALIMRVTKGGGYSERWMLYDNVTCISGDEAKFRVQPRNET